MKWVDKYGLYTGITVTYYYSSTLYNCSWILLLEISIFYLFIIFIAETNIPVGTTPQQIVCDYYIFNSTGK